MRTSLDGCNIGSMAYYLQFLKRNVSLPLFPYSIICMILPLFLSSDCKKFMEVVEEIAESLRKSEEKESEEASSAAGLLEKLTVTESKTEESEIKEASASTEKKGEAKLETEAKAGEASSLA